MVRLAAGIIHSNLNTQKLWIVWLVISFIFRGTDFVFLYFKRIIMNNIPSELRFDIAVSATESSLKLAFIGLPLFVTSTNKE